MTRDGDYELITLRNGARAVRNVVHGEVMHPAGGPWEEANRLYIVQSRLADRLAEAERRRPHARAQRENGVKTDDSPEPLRIFDVGLGAATNAVAAMACPRARPLEIHSFEADLSPLRLALGDPAGFPFLVPFAAAATALMTHGEWEGDGARWVLHHGDYLEELAKLRGDADLVFFDHFSPEHNTSLWTVGAFAALRARCREEQALLLTYSASTAVRVSLLLAGFYVGIGVATGTKRETTVATTERGALSEPLGERWLARWRRSSARAPVGEATLTEARERELLAHPQFSQGY